MLFSSSWRNEFTSLKTTKIFVFTAKKQYKCCYKACVNDIRYVMIMIGNNMFKIGPYYHLNLKKNLYS